MTTDVAKPLAWTSSSRLSILRKYCAK